MGRLTIPGRINFHGVLNLFKYVDGFKQVFRFFPRKEELGADSPRSLTLTVRVMQRSILPFLKGNCTGWANSGALASHPTRSCNHGFLIPRFISGNLPLLKFIQ